MVMKRQDMGLNDDMLRRCRRALEIAIEAANGKNNLARHLGISRQAIAFWDIVPADRLIDVERVTGIARKALRPDLYQGYEAVKPWRKAR